MTATGTRYGRRTPSRPPAGEYVVCADGNNAAVTGSTPQTIAYGHRGGPIKDGPYPASQGYKFCTWVNFQADATGHTNTPTWGVSWFDPIANFTFIDQTQLVSPSGAATISAPGCVHAPSCIGDTSITLSLPLTWEWRVAGPAAPLHGPKKFEIETPFAAGTTISNIVAESQIAFTASLPMPVCAPAGTPVVDCIQGVGGLLVTGSSFPADQECSAPGTCPRNNQVGFDLGFVGGFPIGALESPLCGPSASGTCFWTDAGTTWTYYPCLSTPPTGDSWPSGTPGQPGAPGSINQDQGDVYTLGGATVCGAAGGSSPGTPVSLPNSGADVYGRIIPGVTVPGSLFGSPNPYHLWSQFLPDSWTD